LNISIFFTFLFYNMSKLLLVSAGVPTVVKDITIGKANNFSTGPPGKPSVRSKHVIRNLRVGETKQQLNKRLDGHRHNINNIKNNKYIDKNKDDYNIALHFRQNSELLDKLSFQGTFIYAYPSGLLSQVSAYYQVNDFLNTSISVSVPFAISPISEYVYYPYQAQVAWKLNYSFRSKVDE